MKKQSFRKRSSGAPSRGALIGGAVFAIVAVLGLVRLALPDVFIGASAPLWSAGGGAMHAFGSLFDGFSRTQDIVQERDRLREENESLAAEVRALQTAHDSAKLLFGTSTEQGIIGDVLSRPPFSLYDSLVINKGSDDRVAVSAIVTASGGVPVGTVESVSKNAARVSLFSSAKRETPGWIGASRTPVVLIGSGGGSFTASLPKDVPVKVDDYVYVAPARIPIARVRRIDSNPSSPTQVLQLAPSANPFSITQVLVLPLHSL